MEIERLEQLIAEGEGYNLEFKEKLSGLDKEICALANSSGGKVFLGVKGNGKIKGISIDNRLLSAIQDICRNFEPTFKVTTESVQSVLVVDVPEGIEKPYSVGGKFYIRIGPNSQRMNRKEIMEFFQEVGKISFDETPHSEFDYKDDIDENAFKRFVELSGISPVIDKNQLLENFNLLKDDKVKNAGVLLFAKDISKFVNYATVRCVLFQGTGRTKILDMKVFSSDIYSNYLKSIEYLNEKLNTEYIIKGSGPRTEMLELPEGALKEALLNALAHRDYYKTTPIAVEIFFDRVDIVNPGGLVKGLSLKDLGKRSLPRNNLLFGLFQRMDLVEQAGTGIARIKNEMRDYHLPPPAIEIDENWFVISFERPKDSLEERIKKTREKGLGERLGERLGETQYKIIELMKNNPSITIIQMSKIIGISTTAIEKNIAKLRELGLIQYVGPARGGHWEIIDKDEQG